MDLGQQHSSTFSSKGALPADSQAVSCRIEPDATAAEVWHVVVEDELLDRSTYSARETVGRHVHLRCIGRRDAKLVAALMRIMPCFSGAAAPPLTLFHKNCRVDAVLDDPTINRIHTLEPVNQRYRRLAEGLSVHFSDTSQTAS